MSTVCVTSLTLTDLPRARVLAETLHAAHPDWPLWAVLVDRPPPGHANRAAFAGFARVLDTDTLGLDRAWLFQHDRTDSCIAVKGVMLRHLLRLGAGTVVCLDPDIAVFHPLANLADRLQDASILLTPHRDDGAVDSGFVAVRNDAAGVAFADAWAEAPHFDASSRMPGHIGIVRDPGWNAAILDPSFRPRFTPQGNIAVNGSPLVFCRFPESDATGEAHEPHELWHWYRRRLAAHAEPGIPEDWWHFARFSDGTPIPPAARLLACSRPDVMARFPDPFAAEGDSFLRWLQANAPEMLSSAVPPVPAAR